MKTKILITLTFLFCAVVLFAQDEAPTNSIGLKWGVGHIQRQDFNFSPMIHDTWSPVNLGLNFERSAKWEQRARINFGNYATAISEPFEYYWDTPDEREGSGNHSFMVLDLDYALGKTVYENGKTKISLGGKSNNRLNASYYMYGIYWLGSFGYYLNFSVDAWTNVAYQLSEKSKLELDLALPLFAWNARSPYNSQDDWYFENSISHKDLLTLVEYIKDGELESWGKSQAIDLDLKYKYAISDRFDAGAGYALSIDWNQDPVKFTQVENTFYFSFNLKF